jgi:hypothetical protein
MMALFVYKNILLILQELVIIFQIFKQWLPKLPSVRGFVEHRKLFSHKVPVVGMTYLQK